jgi:hypothetical protein
MIYGRRAQKEVVDAGWKQFTKTAATGDFASTAATDIGLRIHREQP